MKKSNEILESRKKEEEEEEEKRIDPRENFQTLLEFPRNGSLFRVFAR